MVTEITIGNRQYKVEIAKTQEEKTKGLQNVLELPEDEGMLFIYDEPQEVSMWMKDTVIPLDIIFINEDGEVIYVHEGTPNDTKAVTVQDTKYVLEVNAGSGIEVGNELEMEEEDGPVMKVLFPDGSEQMALYGGERIFSRKNTRVLIKKARKAAESQNDSDYKALGKYMFKCIKIQDERKPEYVEAPTTSE